MSKLKSSFGQSQTIILVTRTQLVRADFTAGRPRVLKGLWQRPRPDIDDRGLLVETALKLSRKRARRVVVLLDDLWLQTLHMSTDVTRGLTEHELSRALCFEAEPLSGIPAFDSQVGYVATPSTEQTGPGQRDYCIVQATSTELTQVDDAVRQAGGQLQALGHPATLSQPTAGGLKAPRRRVELWPGAIVYLRQVPGGAAQIHVINADPAQRGWQATVDRWLAEGDSSEPVEWLISDPGIQPPASAAEVFSLGDERSLKSWLCAWAEQLASPESTPVLRPARRPMSKEKRVAITAALAVAAGIAAAGHYTWTERNVADLLGRAKVINDEIARFEAKKKQATELTGKVDKARVQLKTLSDKVGHCAATLEAHRLRWQTLLRLLSELRPEHLVVQKIEGAADVLSISGLCLGPYPANELATDLGSQIGPLGWQVQPAKQESGKRLDSGQPWRFDLVLSELTVKPDLAAAPAAPPRMREPPAAPEPLRPLPPRQPVITVVNLENEGD